jgi:hypothetical protein
MRNRTGLNIHRAEIGRIDFMRDVARITVFFYEKKFTGRENPDEIPYRDSDTDG